MSLMVGPRGQDIKMEERAAAGEARLFPRATSPAQGGELILHLGKD